VVLVEERQLPREVKEMKKYDENGRRPETY
jgi:hypothetical protein